MRESEYPMALPQGTVLAGRYIIKRVLGQGGFGITYAAEEYRTGVIAAVKEYFPEAIAIRKELCVTASSPEHRSDFAYGKESFLSEAKTLSTFIGHPNIVHILCYFEENGTAYFAMEYIEGHSLRAILDKYPGGRMPWEEAKEIFFPVMHALSAVHAAGMIHRDVTPDNIVISKEGTVKLLDFGAARQNLSDQSRSMDVVLKHGYAPIEQYSRHGKQGPYTDVYALCASIYRTLTGELPHDAVDRIRNEPGTQPDKMGKDVPPYVREAVLKGLAVNAQDRFPNISALEEALTCKQPSKSVPGLSGEAVPTKKEGTASNETKEENRQKERQKKPGYIFLCVLAAALIIVGVSVLLIGKSDSQTDVEQEEAAADSTATNADGTSTDETEESAYVCSGETLENYTGEDTELILPTQTSGTALTGIGEKAFYKNNTITEITISEGYTIVGESAFYGCTALEVVEFPKTLQVISDYSFSGCSKLCEVDFPEELRSIGSYAFSGCAALTQIYIPDSVEYIGKCAFADCYGITEISIPVSCEVDDAAFRRCDAKIIYRR